MKRLYKILPLAFLCLGLTSCLKDELYTADTTKAQNIVEFTGEPDESSSAESIYPIYSHSLNYEDLVPLPVTIRYSGTDVAPTDIVVTVAIDNASIIKYNTAADDEVYTPAPNTFYSVPSTQVTIKKGEKTADFIINTKPKQMDYDHDYVIPVTIKSATGTGVSGNFGTALLHIVPKNAYEGDYTATGIFTHPTAGPRDIDRHKYVSTTGKYSVRVEAGDIVTEVGLVIDPVTNNITFTGGVSPSQPFVPIPGESSYYDPATKTFHLNYQYTGTGGFRVIREEIAKD
jgi:hypothetical protein